MNHVSEGGRVGKKEGMDAKRLRPKADQAVSSVSAAPALVNEYCPPLNQRKTELVRVALVYFLDLVFWRSSEIPHTSKDLVRQMAPNTYWVDTYRKLATRSGILDLVTGLILLMPT